jgi:uncharacterized membrane protein YgcG
MTSPDNLNLGVGLVALAAMLVFGNANAQPHMPPPKWEDTVGLPTEPDVWLRRLVGRYRFDGMIEVGACGILPGAALASMPEQECTGVKGMGDCVGIGTGPGVQCIINVTWVDLWDKRGEPKAMSYLDPAMILIGVDPGKSALNYMLVSNKGLPYAGSGTISGNRVTFRNALCASRFFHCVPTMYFEAKPDANLLFIRIDWGEVTEESNPVDEGSGGEIPDGAISGGGVSGGVISREGILGGGISGGRNSGGGNSSRGGAGVGVLYDPPFQNGGSIVMSLRRVPQTDDSAASEKPSVLR